MLKEHQTCILFQVVTAVCFFLFKAYAVVNLKKKVSTDVITI